MRLTRYSDYAVRVLLFLGRHPDRPFSIASIASAYGISKNHLMKIVNDLVSAGYLRSVRGRNGGIVLARSPNEISVGAVIRHTETDLDLVDCTRCVIAPACGLVPVLGEALQAFMAVLDRYTLADVLARKGDISALFRQEVRGNGPPPDEPAPQGLGSAGGGAGVQPSNPTSTAILEQTSPVAGRIVTPARTRPPAKLRSRPRPRDSSP